MHILCVLQFLSPKQITRTPTALCSLAQGSRSAQHSAAADGSSWAPGCVLCPCTAPGSMEHSPIPLHLLYDSWSCRTPEPPLLWTEQPQLSQPLYPAPLLQALLHLGGPVLGSPHLNTRKGSALLFAAEALPTADKITASSLSTEGSLLTHAPLGAHQDPQLLSCRAEPLPAGCPQHFLVLGLFLPSCRTRHFPLLNCTGFLAAHCPACPSHISPATPCSTTKSTASSR